MAEKKRVRKRKRPGNSALSTVPALLDPGRLDIDDLVPQSAIDNGKLKKKGGKGSGPAKYMPHTVRAIFRNVAIGLPEGRAAELAGISARTLCYWKKEYEDLTQALARVNAIAQDELLGKVRAGMERNPRLALDVLERRFPKDWAPQSKHAHAGMILQSAIPPEMMTALYSGRAGRDGEPNDSESVGSNENPIEI